MKKRSLQEELGRLSGVLMSNKSAGSRFAWNPYFPPGVSLPEEEASEIFSPEEESLVLDLIRRMRENSDEEWQRLKHP